MGARPSSFQAETLAERLHREAAERERYRIDFLNTYGEEPESDDDSPDALVSMEPISKVYPVFTEHQLLNRPMPLMLVDDLFIQNTVCQIAAIHGVGKSFVALDLCLSIAAGRDTFLGHTLRRSGPVVYILGEGAGRFGLRIKAWKQHHDVTGELPFYWTDGPIDLLDPEQVEQFITATKALNPVLVVVDTLSRCLVGKDENAQGVMTEAAEAASTICKDLSTTVLMLHHMNASGKRDRGSSVMPGAIDTQFYLTHKLRQVNKRLVPIKDKIVLTSQKQKDQDDTEKIELHRQILEVDGAFEASGELATSCVWVLASEAAIDPVLEYVQANPGLSRNAVVQGVGGKRGKMLKRLKEFLASGQLVEREGGLHIGPKRTGALSALKTPPPEDCEDEDVEYTNDD